MNKPHGILIEAGSAQLQISISRDWDYTVVEMRGNWMTSAVREVAAALSSARFKRHKREGTYYTRQSWRGSAENLRPVVDEARKNRLSGTIKVVASVRGEAPMTIDEILAELED